MKLSANQLRSIISETVRTAKKKRLAEGPVPPMGTTLGSRSVASAVMEDQQVLDAMDTLTNALIGSLVTLLGPESPDGSDIEEQAMTGFQNELHDFVEQWAESLSS